MATTCRPYKRNRIPADPAHQSELPHMALDPADVARRHVWEDLEAWAMGKAETALEGVPRAFAPEDKQYLTTRAETLQKIAAGARTKLETKP
jgi:hypothetical protein